MSTQMLVDVVRRQLKAIDEALSAWKPEDSKIAESVAYVEDGIVVFLDSLSTMKQMVARVWAAQRAGRIANPLGIWHDVSIDFDTVIGWAKPLGQRAQLAQQAGFRVERAEELDRGLHELIELRDDFRKTFPVVTEEEAREDQADLAGGNHLDADEAFARIAGVDVATWRKRVAEHECSDRP